MNDITLQTKVPTQTKILSIYRIRIPIKRFQRGTLLLVHNLFFLLTFNTHSEPNEADIEGKKCHEGEKLTTGRRNSDKVRWRFLYLRVVNLKYLLRNTYFSTLI